jgi:hypothetical protein
MILAAMAAAAGLAPRPAHAQTLVTCESIGNQRRMCAVDTRSGVRLNRQLSDTRCVRGESWGTTRNAVWVSRGCRAQFAVGNASVGSGRFGTWTGANAQALCRSAVLRRSSNRRVSTWVENANRNNVRVGFRTGSGVSGSCRFDRNGNVTLQLDRGRRW